MLGLMACLFWKNTKGMPIMLVLWVSPNWAFIIIVLLASRHCSACPGYELSESLVSWFF
jgi:hypothetical protein